MFVISVLIPSSKCCVILLTTVYLLVMLKTLCLLVGKELPCDSHSFLTWHGLRNNQFVKYDIILKLARLSPSWIPYQLRHTTCTLTNIAIFQQWILG